MLIPKMHQEKEHIKLYSSFMQMCRERGKEQA